MSFIANLDEFIAYSTAARPSVTAVTVAVTEKTARKALKLKKKDALVYRGMSLRCIGSKRWRNEQPS